MTNAKGQQNFSERNDYGKNKVWVKELISQKQRENLERELN